MEKTIIRKLIETVGEDGNYTEMLNENFIKKWEDKFKEEIIKAYSFNFIDKGSFLKTIKKEAETYYNQTYDTISEE